jgi:hypothetical protein
MDLELIFLSHSLRIDLLVLLELFLLYRFQASNLLLQLQYLVLKEDSIKLGALRVLDKRLKI